MLIRLVLFLNLFKTWMVAARMFLKIVIFARNITKGLHRTLFFLCINRKIEICLKT